MSWFFTALVCLLGWGFADVFYKRSSDGDDPFSHVKIAVWVGLVMGAGALALLPFSETLCHGNVVSFFVSAARYAPASAGYIVSMIIGYAGLRYLELSVVSPVQNASGALSAFVMALFFVLTSSDFRGAVENVTGFVFAPASGRDVVLDALLCVGMVCTVAGVVMLAVVEQRLSREASEAGESKRYRYGALALLFPLLYCVFDTLGTAADGVILSDETGLGLGELDVLVLYGLTFFAAGVVAWLWLLVRTRRVYNPFTRSERPKALAALCEEFGQIFYVFAMAARPVLAAPVVASYCIVSVLLSRWLLKERLRPAQYVCVAAVLAGIVCFGIAEGLSL